MARPPKGPKNETPTFAMMLEKFSKANPHLIRRADEPSRLRRIQSGVFQIDRVLGVGFPLNRLNLVYGRKASFKTTLGFKLLKNFLSRCGCCLAPLGQCQQKNNIEKQAVIIDTEHTLDDTEVMKRMGLPMDRIHIFSTYFGEQAIDYAKGVVKMPEVGALMIDSLANLYPKTELEGNALEGRSFGARALLVNRMVRELVALVDSPEMRLVYMTNHLSRGIGMYAADYPPGGGEQIYQSSVVFKVWATDLTENKVEYEDFEDGSMQEKTIGFHLQHSKVSRDNIAVNIRCT